MFRTPHWLRGRLRTHFASLAFVVLVGAQVVSAAHAFSHNEALADDVCEICLQIDRFEHSAVPADVVVPRADHGRAEWLVLPVEAAPADRVGFSPRAPPLI